MAVTVAAVACAAALSLGAGTARAGLVGGLLGNGSSCSYGVEEQPFAAWRDYAQYMLVPGGSFEAGAPGWTLLNGATVVRGNETFYAHSRSDSHSLLLGSLGAAVTPQFCVGLARPTMRFFVSNTGSRSSTLHVTVVYRGLLSILGILDGGTVTAGQAWQPSPTMLATLNAPLGSTSTQLIFTPCDATGNWRIDDVYSDPWLNK